MSSFASKAGEEDLKFKGQNVKEFSQFILKKLMLTTKHANCSLPLGDDYDFYSSYKNFHQYCHFQGKRLLSSITDVIKHEGGNDPKKRKDMEDEFDYLVDTNDLILDNVGLLYDQYNGLDKNDSLLPKGVSNQNMMVATWNKQKNIRINNSYTSKYTLLHARNILRPQLKFSEKVNNSNSPFVHKLFYKPNPYLGSEDIIEDVAKLKSSTLFQQLILNPSKNWKTIIDQSSPLYFGKDHPYQYEIETSNQHFFDVDQFEPNMPNDINDTPLKLITTLNELIEMIKLLQSCQHIAIDLEHHSYRTYLGFTCIMQISTRNIDFIIDTIELRSYLFLFNEVFTDAKIVKVFHGADHDIEWLQKDFGIYVVNMFDTAQASRVLGLHRHSLSFLLSHYCSVETDKHFQLADWRIRPLPDEMILYARKDTHYLLYIFDCMKNDLINAGNKKLNLLQSVLERSKKVSLRKYIKPLHTEESYKEMYFKHKKSFNSQQLFALKLLYEWRDMTARKEDESTGYVLPNHMLFQIAELLPRHSQGILACCNPIPPLVRQQVDEINHLLIQARLASNMKVEISTEYHNTHKESDNPKNSILCSTVHCPHDMSLMKNDIKSGKKLLQKNVCLPLKIVIKSPLFFCTEGHQHK